VPTALAVAAGASCAFSDEFPLTEQRQSVAAKIRKRRWYSDLYVLPFIFSNM
jgi:hypothetical protein